jgi:predicted dehydrogenase
MLLDFGRAGWLEKARQQPERVWQALNKMNTDGVLPTLEAVRSKLEQPVALGYSNVGVVVEAGSGVSGFATGDRVVSNGAHAEWVVVPRNLCARVPAAVTDDEAAFTVLGAIALQGVRLAAPTLGESCAVIGLGLIGLLTVQLLRASGCRVLGIDPDPARCELARAFGADVLAATDDTEVLARAGDFTRAQGLDAVLITAATSSDEPISQAARMSRTRGRIVLVGVAGLKLDRAEFYKKELSFQVSCSYGPGRYDPQYEQQGVDYPIGFVRWTEQRNFQAVLEMLASRRLDVRPLISHRFAFEQAGAAYELLAPGAEPSLGVLLDYHSSLAPPRREGVVTLSSAVGAAGNEGTPRVGFIGAGNYAGRVLIPAFVKSGARLQAIASAGGVTAAHYGRKFGFARATTDSAALLAADDIDLVVIATRHDSHAELVTHALRRGKHVFVEKPLALKSDELDAIVTAWQERRTAGQAVQLLVGFNRRFATQVIKMKALLSELPGPKVLVATINAGAIPAEHWTQDARLGGGRIAGEACHFVDLLRHLAGHAIVDVAAHALEASGNHPADSATLELRFADGSLGTIHYLANGHRAFPKERVEVFCSGHILQLDNFRRLRGYGWRTFRSLNLWRQDKGQDALVESFIAAIHSGGAAPIAFDELIEVSRAAIALGEAAQR